VIGKAKTCNRDASTGKALSEVPRDVLSISRINQKELALPVLKHGSRSLLSVQV